MDVALWLVYFKFHDGDGLPVSISLFPINCSLSMFHALLRFITRIVIIVITAWKWWFALPWLIVGS
ncbi:hypothetical protein EV363DRAFT_1309675 [Boletus edulis]|nr:hypothetical protein EV363DRAFT_1309675 [Boletus edulis]